MSPTKRIGIVDIADAARLAEAVYWTRDQAAAEARVMGFSEIHHVGNNGGAACLVVGDAEKLIVVVRGTQTDDPADLFADALLIPRRDYQGGFVQRGYYAHGMSIWLEIEPFVLAAAERQLWFVGHSLGGIVANLMAAWSGVLRRVAAAPLAHVITFGAPMGASPTFLQAMWNQTSSITRVTNNLDPIPFCAMWPLYRHPAGRHLHLTDRGKAIWNPTLSERWRDVPDSIVGKLFRFVVTAVLRRSVLRGVLAATNIHDHGMVKYREKIDGCVDAILENSSMGAAALGVRSVDGDGGGGW